MLKKISFVVLMLNVTSSICMNWEEGKQKEKKDSHSAVFFGVSLVSTREFPEKMVNEFLKVKSQKTDKATEKAKL